MAGDSQYRVLLSKYNVAVARIRDLEEQNRTNNQHWKTEVAALKTDLDAARSLCESILAKDHKEMVLGKESSWYSTPIGVLIARASKSYIEYNKKITSVLNNIQTECERRGNRVNSLKSQIDQFIEGDTTAFDVGDMDTLPPAEEKLKKSPEHLGVPKSVQKAADAGTIEVIIEESRDVADKIEDGIEELVNAQAQARLTSNGIPVQNSQKKQEQFKKAKNTADMSHVVDLLKFEEKFTPAMWKLLEIIGKEGVSRYPDIEQLALESELNLKATQLRSSIRELHRMNAVKLDSFSLPLTSRVLIYRLDQIGERLFCKQFGVAPVESEAAKVIREHDNLEHGYGILDLGKLLMASGYYRDVQTFNRSNPKKLNNGTLYVADLVCTPSHGRYVEYIEYERGFHKQSDFNVKCNKICEFTRHLNFVAPNKEAIINNLKPQIDEWIRSRGRESISTIRIRISTPVEFRNNKNISNAWIMMYDLSKGIEPIKDFTKKEPDPQ